MNIAKTLMTVGLGAILTVTSATAFAKTKAPKNELAAKTNATKTKHKKHHKAKTKKMTAPAAEKKAS